MGANFNTMRVNSTNRDEAEDYICDRAEKWSDALAVTVQTEDETYTLIGGWCAS